MVSKIASVDQAIARARSLARRGEVAKAREFYQAILAKFPDNKRAMEGLKSVSSTGSVRSTPVLTREQLNNVIALYSAGRLKEAMAAVRGLISNNRDVPVLHNLSGAIHAGLGKLDEAAGSFRTALTIKPDFADAHNNLGKVLRDQGKHEEAVASFRSALRIKPDYAEAHNGLGNVLNHLGRHDEAIACYRKCLEIKPDYAKAHYNLADVLEKGNRTEDLREAVNRAKLHCPGHPRLAMSQAQLFKKDGDFAAGRATMENLAKPVADTRFMGARAQLLGDLCDRLGDSDAAFTYFEEANAHRKDTPQAKRVDAKRYLTRIDDLIDRYTDDWIAGWKPLDCSGDRPDPVFLVGFPRSGTTLLDTILRSHAGITVVEEISAVQSMRRLLDQLHGDDPEALAKLDPAGLAALREAYFTELDKHLEPQDRSVVVIDKLPLNTVHAGLIHRVFPQARFVFVQRHPCDCVLSGFMQSFDLNDAMANFLDLKDAARLYDKAMTLWLQYQAVLPLKVHTVRYESLISAFESTLSDIFEFLDIDWDDAVLNYAETARQRGRINTPSYSQVTQKLYTRAQGRWERYREHLQPVLPLLLPWATRFGYDE